MTINSALYLQSWMNLTENPLKTLENNGVIVKEIPLTDEISLVNLAYGLKTPKNIGIYTYCRGAVLEWNKKKDSFSLLAYSFDRFFNPNEPYAAPIDWDGGVKVYDKADGTMIQLFFYQGLWRVGTTGTPLGEGTIKEGEPRTFAELFWDSFYGLGYSTDSLDRSLCYTLELCTPENPIVIDYGGETKIFLLAARDISHWNEVDIDLLSVPFEKVKTLDLPDLESVFDYCSGLKGTSAEGCVVKDRHNNRIKVKAESYLRMHKLWSNISDIDSYRQLWYDDDLDEAIAYFGSTLTELKQFKQTFESKLNKLNSQIRDFITSNSHLDQKEFAKKNLKTHPKVLTDAFFKARLNGIENFSVENWVKGLPKSTFKSWTKEW